jgi:hypothetical protein
LIFWHKEKAIDPSGIGTLACRSRSLSRTPVQNQITCIIITFAFSLVRVGAVAHATVFQDAGKQGNGYSLAKKKKKKNKKENFNNYMAVPNRFSMLTQSTGILELQYRIQKTESFPRLVLLFYLQ